MFLCLAGSTYAAPAQAELEFMCGISTWGTRTGSLRHIKSLGAKWHAPFLNWDRVEPTIPRSEIGLTVADVKADPGMIDTYIEARDWGKFDAVITALRRHGLKLFPIVGQCFTSTVPKVDGKPIVPHDPDTPVTFFDNPVGRQVHPVSRDHFLGHLYLHVRAVVRRYKQIRFWMVDPEINQSALFRVFGGWKVGAAWADWDFVTKTVQTLSQAIKDEEPADLVCLPMNTDQPPAVTFTYARTPWLSGGNVTVRDWPDAITEWLPHLDIVGVDFFESQGTTDPSCYERIKQRIETAVQRAEGKPVTVASIGCPSGPEILGWNEANQSTYISQAFDAAADGGARGFFYFEIRTSERHRAKITAFDRDVMNRARTVYNRAWDQTEMQFGAAFGELSGWLFGKRGGFQPTVDYMKGHFFRVLETAEGYWGLVRKDGTPKPSFHALRERYLAKTPPR